MGYVATEYRVKHRDYFNHKKFYKACHEWLVEQGWAPRKDKEFPETKFLHRYLANGTQEMWIWWRCNKGVKSSNYFDYHLDINFHVLYLKETNYMYRNKKFKAALGEVEVKVRARLETDVGDKWANHPILKNFNDLIWKRIYREDLQTHRVELQREAYRFQDWMKRFFKYPTTLAEPSGQGDFIPQLGIDEY